ncbi:hypothetical protein GCM10007242_16900 [Pigmentiphaga litoralis]|uniref:helix-turn-helix transcriptional regulator n=1 Tax=Pigmentiphaga litoralis TaxID=516702 RepID=UPI0019ABF911|nr:hypothetical protein [Pigmentiphaga litoralis]GGX11396.1 hypothetical protein GCM10007242_16900 [Pigmentiphaga litoralis]
MNKQQSPQGINRTELVAAQSAHMAAAREAAAQIQVYRMASAVRLLGISKASIYRRIADGDLVKVSLGPRATGITAESIRAFLTKDQTGAP